MPKPNRNIISTFVLLVGATSLLGLSGCDSLRARLLAQDGVTLYRKGDANAAADKFEEASKLDPYIPTIQLNLGFANLSLYQGNPNTPEGRTAAGKAITAFERFLQLRPTEERAKSYLIQTFVDTGHYDAAVDYFKPQTDKNPPDSEALATLGTIASKTGRFKEARSWYEKRVEVDPNNADARLAVGVLLWDYLHNHADVTGVNRLLMSDQALAHLNAAIKIKPNAPNSFLYANLVYREKAGGEITDDAKRVDLEQANKLFKQAQDLQKGVR